jgi:hypothetical protein
MVYKLSTNVYKLSTNVYKLTLANFLSSIFNLESTEHNLVANLYILSLLISYFTTFLICSGFCFCFYCYFSYISTNTCNLILIFPPNGDCALIVPSSLYSYRRQQGAHQKGFQNRHGNHLQYKR